jgi:hypothetical protein
VLLKASREGDEEAAIDAGCKKNIGHLSVDSSSEARGRFIQVNCFTQPPVKKAAVEAEKSP